ncbi:iron chelate uptake ABC transporter family permease subunit [Escherichia coli]|uniref:iron chelate uptake ABC transporter family permease subunit n=1 Tax=Escherichia coli TaxID=562 RepID=UPI000450B162|nr:hypothetical protein BY74_23705 [Escherichia coli O157:H7 str. K2845]
MRVLVNFWLTVVMLCCCVCNWSAIQTMVAKLPFFTSCTFTLSVGPIAFIGLMMPHMARWLVGADHRWSLPVTLLATPALLLFADIIGRVIVPGELRVSVVSAFIGAPVLIFLVRRKTRGGA